MNYHGLSVNNKKKINELITMKNWFKSTARVENSSFNVWID